MELNSNVPDGPIENKWTHHIDNIIHLQHIRNILFVRVNNNRYTHCNIIISYYR